MNIDKKVRRNMNHVVLAGIILLAYNFICECNMSTLHAQESKRVFIISQGSTGWKYSLDYPSRFPPEDVQGKTWYELGYDDSTWKKGNAPFGYGDKPRAVYGAELPDIKGSYFFRKSFYVKKLKEIRGLTLKTASDNSAVVYINGKEVDKDQGTHEFKYWNRETEIDPSVLKEGKNLIAVYLYNNPGSSDAYLDLEIAAGEKEILVLRGESRSFDLFQRANQDVSRVENGIPLEWQKALTFEKAGKSIVAFRAVFQIEDPACFAALALEKPLCNRDIVSWRVLPRWDLILNGKSIPLPIKGMAYKTIPGIPVSLLKKGENVFRATWTQQVKKQKGKKTSEITITPERLEAASVNIRLLGLMPSALAIQTGPILGYAGTDFFTMTCRVNIPAQAVLEVNDRQYVSKPALLHSFKVEGLIPNTQYHYSLKARLLSRDDIMVSAGPYSVRTLPVGGRFSFAILGDSRTHPNDWAKVAAAVVRVNPAFSVFVGDMVARGMIDSQWDEEYFSPAKDFFATIPYYAVIGNHEQNCPLFTHIFPTPGGKNWSQKIGSALFIGIDGNMDWTSGSDLTKWLEDILAKSKAKFIFLVSHYPAWTSGYHGKLGKDGRPAEKSVRLAQDVLMPLLKKYNATAMFAGHDHFYERSEPEEGITMIITGGAGAPLRNKAQNAEKQNPYSKVFAKKHHYCLFTIDRDVCTMKVFTPEGKMIDTRTWTARN